MEEVVADSQAEKQNVSAEAEAQRWATAVQLEQCRAAKTNALMQAIIAIPMFDGTPGELEFFLKRMDLVVQQMLTNPLDDATNNYIIGYFYSRISLNVITEIGLSCDTPWDDVKKLLREKYGGTARSIPRLIVREILMSRESGDSPASYAKTVLTGFRKVQHRLKDATENQDEAQIRCKFLEEIAQEILVSNVPRRVKQWIKIAKPTSLDALVKTIEEDEMEEKEERWEELKRRPYRGPPMRGAGEDQWQKVERRNKNLQFRIQAARPTPRNNQQVRRGETPYRTSRFGVARERGCWECGEVGHFARECPYIYRRNNNNNNRIKEQQGWKGKSFEVNKIKTRRYDRRSRWNTDSENETASTYSSDSESVDYIEKRKKFQKKRGNQEEWPELPPRQDQVNKETKLRKD